MADERKPDYSATKEEIDHAIEGAERSAARREQKKKRSKSEKLLTPRVFLASLRYVAIAVCLGIVIYEGYQIVKNRMQHAEARNEYASLSDSYVTVDASSQGKGISIDGEEDTETYPNLAIDFEALRKINSDLIAWLYFPALDLSYPVVKERKTDEYLTKTFAGTYNGAGAVFMDHWSSARFNGMSDFVFAHNMNDRSMFGQLTILTVEGNEHLLDDDPYIYIYTEDIVYRYEAFAYYQCAGGGAVYANVGADESKYDEVLAYMLEHNMYDKPNPLDFSERPGLLSLSTCTDWGDARFLVSGAKDHIWYLTEEAKRSEGYEYEEITEQYLTVNDAHGTSDEQRAAGASAKPYPDLSIDFAGLKELNENTISWLYVPALGISFPVVAEETENEYLAKSISGRDDPVGAIFMDIMSDKTFGGWNDFVFGHYLSNGQMFGALSPLMEEEVAEDVFGEEPYIYVYLEDKVVRYRVYAYYWAEMGDDAYIQAEKPEHLDRVIAYMDEHNLYKGTRGIDLSKVKTEERPGLLHLSTCADFGDKTRFLLSAYREGEWKK